MENKIGYTLTSDQLNEVSGGGFWVHWALGAMLNQAISEYAGWVSGGAGGWTVEYNGEGYDDPLL